MSGHKLDRLSALLKGLAPEVALTPVPRRWFSWEPTLGDGETLRVYLVTRGAMELGLLSRSSRVEAPTLVAMRANQPHALKNLSAAGSCTLVCAMIRLTGPIATLFLEEFTGVRRLILSEEDSALRLAVSLIEAELVEPRCGQPALLVCAGEILFIGLLRHLVAQAGTQGHGLFGGLADARIAKALVAMHQRPSFAWNLERLAAEAGMSRTAFALRFRDVMKRTPGRYLSSIRLALARREVDLGRGLKEAARAAGYTNTSALSRALGKTLGRRST
jgi:AraC-like DNA-binding protein